MTSPPAEKHNPLQGVLLICFAVFCFVCMNQLVQYVGKVEGHPVPQIIWARYFFHLILIMLFFPKRIGSLLVSERKGMQVLRSILVLLATLCMFFAVQEMLLSDAVAISFVAPLFAVGLSVLILRERVGWRRWLAVGIGFVGVLIIIRPGAGALQWAALLPLSMAFFYALYQVVTRMIRAAADPLNALFYTALVGAVVCTIAVPFYWKTPDLAGWAMLVGTGVFGGIGHYAVIRAYERAQVSVIAPFAYTELFWATLGDLAVFGRVPDGWVYVGAAVIAAAGIYVLHRERLRSVPPSPG